MSGKSYLEVMNEAADRVARIKPELNQKKIDLENEERRYREANQKAWELLRAMDLDSTGNAEWAGRFEEFLKLIIVYRRSL